MHEIEEARKNRRIDLLYKNLGHVSNAYNAEESIFPLWESAFALIIGQLFIAFFDKGASRYLMPLAFLGLTLSIFWLALVSLNLKNAQHVVGQIEDLHKSLADELHSLNLEFVKPWPEDEGKKNWCWLGNILLGSKPKCMVKSEAKGRTTSDRPMVSRFIDLSKSTWIWRRMLPVLLIISWSYLLHCAWIDP